MRETEKNLLGKEEEGGCEFRLGRLGEKKGTCDTTALARRSRRKEGGGKKKLRDPLGFF